MEINRFTREIYEMIKMSSMNLYIYGTSYDNGNMLRVLTLADLKITGFLNDDELDLGVFHMYPVVKILDIREKVGRVPSAVFVMESVSQKFISDNADLDLFVVTVGGADILGTAWIDIIGQVPKVYQKMYNRGGGVFERFKEISFPVKRIYKDGSWMMGDHVSTLVNIENGERLICRNKGSYRHHLYLLGQSFMYGYGCEDRDTIGNHLQKFIDDNLMEYKVHNTAVIGQTFIEMYHRLLILPIKAGDLVIVSNAILAFSIQSGFENNTIEDNCFICYYLLEQMQEYCKKSKADLIFVKIPSVSDVLRPNKWEKTLQRLNYQEENKKLGKAVTSDDHHMYLSVDWDIIGMLCVSRYLSYFDAKDVVNCKRNIELFYDWLHLSPKGNELIAVYIFKCLNIGRVYESRNRQVADLVETVEKTNDNNVFQSYIDDLKNIAPENWSQTPGGCIVMNANPFTKGHLYLIEYALKNVDWLMVFVLEEDKSEFSFEERIKLVREGTKNLKNIVVMPSGEYIISHSTFPEYFNKSELQETRIDAGLDIDIFGKKIAKELNIKKRFVGEEPYCMITKQYNMQMKQKLPQYGVELIEIPRLEMHGTAISASRVRNLINRGDADALSNILPDSTLAYVLKHEKWLAKKVLVNEGE